MNIKQISTIILLLMLGSLFATQVSIGEFESLIWRLTNAERAKNNLPPLAYDEGLANLSRRHSKNMQDDHFFDHKDKEGRFVNDRKRIYYPQLLVSSIGENLARFYNTEGYFTAEEIIRGWMNSPLHRENILNPNYTHLGVGVINNRGLLLATQNFATAIVKLQSPTPKRVRLKRRLTLDFEYMSPQASDKLIASLSFPKKEQLYQVSRTYYCIGSMPVQLKWVDSTHFTVDLEFIAGKGEYELTFGFGGGYYEEGITLKVK